MLSPVTPDHLEHLRRESARFRRVIATCSPAQPVPGCPAWSAADLLWHLGRVQWFWSLIVASRPAGPTDLDVDEPPRPERYADLLDAFDRHSAGLADAFADAEPDDPSWTWGQEQSVRFALRRQAHEVLIHRVDAEQTAGRAVTGIDPVLAADGVEEFLSVILPATGGGVDVTGTGQHVLLEADDVPARVWLELGAEGDARVVDDPRVAPVAVVRAPAAHLDLWLWDRHEDPPRVAGRVSAYEQLLGVLRGRG